MNRNLVSVLLILLIILTGSAYVQAMPATDSTSQLVRATLYNAVINGQTINRQRVENCLVIEQPVILDEVTSTYHWLYLPINTVELTVDAWRNRRITAYQGVLTAYNPDCPQPYNGR